MRMAALQHAYARLRNVPVAGVLASRLVWAAKGALGRPLALPAGSLTAPPPRASPVREAPSPSTDTRLQVALSAAEVLSERLSRLEAAPVHPAAPGTAWTPAPRSVSVIVSTLDRAAWLDRALTALAAQRHAAFEVIVVAGPCRDGTADVLQRHARRVRVAHCGSANLSASRNLGLKLAVGDIVAFLDDDAAPEPDWLEQLLAAYSDPELGGVGGYIRDHTGRAYQCRVVVADRFGRSGEVGELGRAHLDPPGPAVGRYLSLTGANCSFRRRALLEIGGFDEAYAYFLDETDVCLRMVEAGWRLGVAPEAEVHHAYAPSAQRRADHTPLSLVDCVRSTTYFALRNAAPRHGLAAAADHLQAHADGLRRDTGWRRDQGLIAGSHAEMLNAEIEAGITQGVRLALGEPRRLMAKPRDPEICDIPFAAPPIIKPAADRLRLCLLSQDYPASDLLVPPAGGIAVWTRALAEAMAADGHEVTVITRASGDEPAACLQVTEGAGVWVHRIAGRPLGQHSRRTGLLAGLPASIAEPALSAAQEVERIAPRRRFDLVMGPLWDLEPAALVGGPCPVAVSLHTACAQMAAFKPDWTGDYRRAHVDKVIAGERRLLARAPYVLANSRAAVTDIAAALNLPDLPDRAVMIPHGLPDLARGVAAARRDTGVEILFVGRLERRKGVDVLLAAAPLVLSAAPQARLVLVGEETPVAGEETYREAFLKRHRGAAWMRRVRFEGPLGRKALLARYAACDLVVAPSRYESFGLTALEAMIFAKPCIASDVGGLPEVVADRETGLLVPPDDPEALAAALLRLINDEDLRRAMGAAGRRRYEARFTAEKMAQAACAWFSSLVASGRSIAAE